jgi:hypothetical protein
VCSRQVASQSFDDERVAVVKSGLERVGRVRSLSGELVCAELRGDAGQLAVGLDDCRQLAGTLGLRFLDRHSTQGAAHLLRVVSVNSGEKVSAIR